MTEQHDPADGRARLRVDDLDATDRRLVALLQDDGRASYADLGAAVGLSPAGTRLRVLRLQERGVLQIVAVTDPLAVGYGQMAQIGVVVAGGSDVRAVADAVSAEAAVIYLVLTAGSFDLMVEVVATDADDLFDVVGRVRAVPGVARAETFPYYGIHTHRFTWGVRP